MPSPQCQLREEIEFWEELIASPGGVASVEARERMEQALALARRKLRLLQDEGPERNDSPPLSKPETRAH